MDHRQGIVLRQIEPQRHHKRVGCAAAIVASLAVREERALDRLYQTAFGASLLALPLLRMAMDGADWGQLMAGGNTAVIVFGLVLLLAGVGIILAATGLRLRATKAPRSVDQVAAE